MSSRRDPRRDRAVYLLYRSMVIGLVVFVPIMVVLRFALPRGSHAFQFVGLGYGVSVGTSLAAAQERGWQVAWRMAFVQLSTAIVAVAAAWLWGV